MINKNLLTKTRRIYVKQEIYLQKPIIQDMHYIKNVIRLKNQEYIRAFNQKQEFLCIFQNNQLIPIQLIRNNLICNNNIKVSVAIAILKQNAMNDAISSIAQFELHKIYPLITERTQVRNINFNKYETIIQSSTEQSEKMNLIDLCKEIKLENLLKINNVNIICCDEAFYYENLSNIESINSIEDKILNTESQLILNTESQLNNMLKNTNAKANFDNIMQITDVQKRIISFNTIQNTKENNKCNIKNKYHTQNIFSKINGLDKTKEFIIIIGPEGGFSQDEHELIAKISPTYLNFPTILKSEVAAIASLSIITEILKD